LTVIGKVLEVVDVQNNLFYNGYSVPPLFWSKST